MLALRHENVGRLDVAMDDAFGVRGIKGVGNLDGQRQNEFWFHRLPCDAMLQRQTVQTLHGNERFAVLVVDFVDGADVRMIQGRSGLGFALETAEGLRIFGYVVGQELQGHKPAELYVFSLVHHTHSATADLFDDAVMRDGFADQRSCVRHLAHILGCGPDQVNEERPLAGQVLINALAGEVKS